MGAVTARHRREAGQRGDLRVGDQLFEVWTAAAAAAAAAAVSAADAADAADVSVACAPRAGGC